jgi:hypothetical protein
MGIDDNHRKFLLKGATRRGGPGSKCGEAPCEHQDLELWHTEPLSLPNRSGDFSRDLENYAFISQVEDDRSREIEEI